MATATLDVPLTIDPTQAAKLVIRAGHIDFDARVVTFSVDLIASDGVTILARRNITASGAAVQTWITNQEATLYNRLLAQLGVTGTVA